MIKLAVVASLLFPLVAHADNDTAGTAAATTTTTTTANTVVVVTPNPPIVVSGASAIAPVLAPPGGLGQPVVAPGAPGNGAPQNEDWNNVSHINGTPIPVGERGAYLYKFKKTNISVNPFGLFFGYYDAAGSYALSQNVAVSVSVSGWSLSSGERQSGYQVTASLPIYFRRTYSGPFLEPGLIVRSSSNSYNYAYECGDCSTSDGTTAAWAGPELLFGWHWTFDSGLNISTAFGVAKHMAANANQSASDSSDATDFNGYFRVGYAF